MHIEICGAEISFPEAILDALCAVTLCAESESASIAIVTSPSG